MENKENASGNESRDATRGADAEVGRDPHKYEDDVRLLSDDEAPVEEELADVDVNNSVSSEHPGAGTGGSDDLEESRDLPASDPESGA